MLLHIIIVLVVVGFVMWLVNAYIPMEDKVKTLLNIAVVVILVVWLLQSFGLLGPLGSVGIR